MVKAYVEEKVHIWFPKTRLEQENRNYHIRAVEDDRELAFFGYKAGVGEWFKHNRQYVLVDKDD